MSGLRTLRVKLEIVLASQERWRICERRVLQSVAGVTAPEDFELAVPWKSIYQDSVTNPLPCRVSRFEMRFRQ